MISNTEFRELQKDQKEHDIGYHHDVYTLPYPDRMNHYALHFAKYVGRLSRGHSDPQVEENQLKKTIADCFIVALASANTLNVDLQSEVPQQLNTRIDPIQEPNLEESTSQERVRKWLFVQLSAPMGDISNAMESLDHIESMDTRKIFEESTIQIVSILLSAMEEFEDSITMLVTNRWEQIERNFEF